MMRHLDYQDRVLTALDDYLGRLKETKAEADEIAEFAKSKPHLAFMVPDFSEEAWNRLKAVGKLPPSRANYLYSPRMDGVDRPVPNAVLKVPTGGGKTYLAVSALSRIMGRYLGRNTGFVLWIVPNEAIYTQTIKRLRDRQHPYRQALDRAAAGRVRIMEKGDRLDARDVESNLCVMLLMLQAANRETKDTLTMFRDRGDVHGFTPPEGNQEAHAKLREDIPNLDIYDLADGTAAWPTVKDSLGNALRIIRPVVVLDEGHRAISDLAFHTLYGFNPCFVLELTATPQDVQARGGSNPRDARYANVLVEVTGRELDTEGMIKMPLNLETRQGNDWRGTLAVALDKLNVLDADAAMLRADTNRYIRPIMLVQVERTGQDQRDGTHIHAEDVKDWLLTAGFDEAEIAIKTAERNDLNQPENQNLLSSTNRVRAIITKQALQEGWDCPFAYVLCALSASGNLKAMTQLVGRILRQPDGRKTEIPALDECHVITHHAGTGEVVAAVKKGLEQDGLADLVLAVAPSNGGGETSGPRTIRRREKFAKTDIYLPNVLLVDGAEIRDLDYETDVLPAIDWRGFDPKEIAARIPENARAAEAQIHRISLTDKEHEQIATDQVAVASESLMFDPAHAVRMISDVVLNPFVGREIVGRILGALEKRGFDHEKIGRLAGLITDELRKGLIEEQAKRAEALFKSDVASGRIQFRLRMDGQNWQMPFEIETAEPDNADQLNSKSGGPLERSLFKPVYRNELNKDERDVAIYLDGENALNWWHRNVARRQYGLQGWRRGKIFPDFIFAVNRDSGTQRLVVLETKGDQLNNPETTYKKQVLDFMTENFAWEKTPPAGTLKLVKDNGETVECALVLMSKWETELPELLKSGD